MCTYFIIIIFVLYICFTAPQLLGTNSILSYLSIQRILCILILLVRDQRPRISYITINSSLQPSHIAPGQAPLLHTVVPKKGSNFCQALQMKEVLIDLRPGKSCKLSSSGKFRILQCPQKRQRQRETCVLNVGVT